MLYIVNLFFCWIVKGTLDAKKAMLVRFNLKTDLHVEEVKYDLRLSRANITFIIDLISCFFFQLISQLIIFSYENILNILIDLIMTNIISFFGPIFEFKLANSWKLKCNKNVYICHFLSDGTQVSICTFMISFLFVRFLRFDFEYEWQSQIIAYMYVYSPL